MIYQTGLPVLATCTQHSQLRTLHFIHYAASTGATDAKSSMWSAPCGSESVLYAAQKIEWHSTVETASSRELNGCDSERRVEWRKNTPPWRL